MNIVIETVDNATARAMGGEHSKGRRIKIPHCSVQFTGGRSAVATLDEEDAGFVTAWLQDYNGCVSYEVQPA